MNRIELTAEEREMFEGLPENAYGELLDLGEWLLMWAGVIGFIPFWTYADYNLSHYEWSTCRIALWFFSTSFGGA